MQIHSLSKNVFKRTCYLAVMTQLLLMFGIVQDEQYPEALLWGSILMAQDDCSFAPSRLLVFSRGIKLFHLTVYGIAIRMLPILLITLSSIWIHSFDSILALQLAILGLSTSIIGAYFQTVSNGATYLSLALTILTLCITNTLPLNPLDKLNSGLFVEFLVFETLLCFGFGAAYSFSLRRR